MITKLCTVCNKESFKRKECSEVCRKIHNREYQKNWWKKNKDKSISYHKKWFNNGGKDTRKRYTRKYKSEGRDKWYEKNGRENKAKYYLDNKEKISLQRKEYRKTEKYKKIKKEYNKKNAFKIRYRYLLRSYLRRVNNIKYDKSENILGYSILEFKKHIEYLFKSDMSWDSKNFHIDHIVPISAFIEGTDPKIVNSLENLRPIYIIENKLKFNNIDFTQIEIYIKFKNFLTDYYQQEINKSN